jgi:hypothetical protein
LGKDSFAAYATPLYARTVLGDAVEFVLAELSALVGMSNIPTSVTESTAVSKKDFLKEFDSRIDPKFN